MQAAFDAVIGPPRDGPMIHVVPGVAGQYGATMGRIEALEDTVGVIGEVTMNRSSTNT